MLRHLFGSLDGIWGTRVVEDVSEQSLLDGVQQLGLAVRWDRRIGQDRTDVLFDIYLVGRLVRTRDVERVDLVVQEALPLRVRRYNRKLCVRL